MPGRVGVRAEGVCDRLPQSSAECNNAGCWVLSDRTSDKARFSSQDILQMVCNIYIEKKKSVFFKSQMNVTHYEKETEF